MFKRILVAIDGSEESCKALEVAVALAKKGHTELHGVVVRRHFTSFALNQKNNEIESFALEAYEQAMDMAEGEGIQLECEFRFGNKVNSILKFARDRSFDLLVVGLKNERSVLRRFGGDTSLKLLRASPCPILVVR